MQKHLTETILWACYLNVSEIELLLHEVCLHVALFVCRSSKVICLISFCVKNEEAILPNSAELIHHIGLILYLQHFDFSSIFINALALGCLLSVCDTYEKFM